MCKLFIGADVSLWEMRAKSLRIDGMATSIRLENFFWSTLEEIGTRDGMSVNQLITRLYHEALDADHDMGNFTSFLRVCCARYHALIAAGEFTAGTKTSLRDVDAEAVLTREASRRAQAKLHNSQPTGRHN
ncbi:MAG: ribbon-helix-helix domain-containing protein [Rhodobacteraceae bacterium]|nr:ribbon-helix-helix domain-containing protein [Paracoccaceae bacterium]